MIYTINIHTTELVLIHRTASCGPGAPALNGSTPAPLQALRSFVSIHAPSLDTVPELGIAQCSAVPHGYLRYFEMI